MIVTCRNCNTKFNLPDKQAAPGAKLRCSVCKYVFTLADAMDDPDEPDAQDLDLSLTQTDLPKEKKSRKTLIGVVLTLLILCVGAGGTWWAWKYSPFLDDVKKLIAPAEKQDPVDLVRLIALRGVRQYNISNEKLGNISVVEGKTVNGFPDPRELIRVEAALYDAEGKVLVSKQQLAGTSVSLFQLQVLGEQELEQALANKIDILTNNTNVPPGTEVPFMVVFYSPPDNAAEFGVKVIDARLPPEKN
ncbi:MAG: DUF3426 domain-containing protein [Bilophila sp.]